MSAAEMLNDKETTFAKELLAYLETEDLVSLTKTTTNDVVVPTSRNEAITAILLHTETIHVLLSRKKITKEILFKYLHDRQQNVSISEQRDQLKKRVLGLHGIRDRRIVRFDDSVRKLVNESDDSGAGSDISGSEDCDSKETSSGHQSVQLHSSSTRETSQEVVSGTQCNNQHQNSVRATDTVQCSSAISVQQDFPVAEFSQQFVTWFYNLLNDGSVEADHFWMDATAEMLLLPGEQVSRGNTSSGVSQLLGWIRHHLGLTFNPNVSREGVHGRLDAHGLMVVFACGTLHTPERCVGVFTQQFSLARDPFSNNNWKVKNSRAVLRCPGNTLELGAIEMPRLDSPSSDLPLLEPSSV